MSDRQKTRAELMALMAEIQHETKKRMDELTSILCSVPDRHEESDPDYKLFELANSVLARGDATVREAERLRREFEPPTVFFLDYSGSMTEGQIRAGLKLIRERMERSAADCGAIGFDARPSPLVDMMSGPMAARYVRDPIEVRARVNGVNGGGGTSAESAVRFCDEPRLGGMVDSYAGRWRGRVRKVVVTDGDMTDSDLALFDEVVVIPREALDGQG